MGQTKKRNKPLRVKLFCGLIGTADSIEEAGRLLAVEFGAVDCRSPLLPFVWTDYYEAEMGKSLKRMWIAFAELKERGYLARAKHAAVSVETALSAGGRRTVNIDPGYVDDAQVVLATAKNFSHRIYIGMGYYAEVTMIYSSGSGGFGGLRWTYPDYLSDEGTRFFMDVRARYHKQVKAVDAS